MEWDLNPTKRRLNCGDMELFNRKWWRKTASIALIVSMTAEPATPVMALDIPKGIGSDIGPTSAAGIRNIRGGRQYGTG